MSAHFLLVPLTPQVWDEYAYWYRRREQKCPKPPAQGIFCAAEYIDQGVPHRSLVAGVCVYNTDGEYVLFEHLSTNPTTHPNICHQAVSLIAHAARGYGAIVGKTMVALVESVGISRIMRRAGFNPGRLSVTFARGRGATLYAAPEYVIGPVRFKNANKVVPNSQGIPEPERPLPDQEMGQSEARGDVRAIGLAESSGAGVLSDDASVLHLPVLDPGQSEGPAERAGRGSKAD